MLHVFIDESAFGILAKREFGKIEGRRMDWLVDVVPMISTYAVEFDSQKKVYEVKESVRDDRGDWKNHETGVTITDISIAEADDTASLLELVTDENTQNKAIYLGLLLARQVEDYLYEIDFWASNEEPDEEKGGVFISAVDEELCACVVFGKDRPDMKYVPYRLHYRGGVPVLQQEEPEMGRPYYDEFMENLLAKAKDSDSGIHSELCEDEDEELFGEDEELFDEEATEADDESEDGFLNTLGKFYLDINTLESIADLDIEQNNNDLTFAVEIIEIPFTMVYAPTSDTIRRLAGKFDGLSEIDTADAFLLFFERTQIGSYDFNVKAVLTITHGGNIQGGASDELISDNFGVFLNAAYKLNAFFNSDDIYNVYQELDPLTSGIMLSIADDEIQCEMVSGKDRPDLACLTLFGGVDMSRPYVDEVMDHWGNEMMPIEEKIALAEEGDEEMMDMLAMIYLNGDMEVDPDPQKAVYWFEKLAECDNPNAQFSLGLHYAKGYGVERSFEKSLYWFEKAEENGDEDASAVITKLKKAVEAEKIVSTGDAQAQADLAGVYMFLGNSLEQCGPEKDYEIAFDLATKSAQQNNGDGIWALALAYQHGRGVEQDVDKAIELYRKGAEIGHAPSQHSLACYYFRGDVLEQNDEKAFDLCMKSAKQGYGLAMADVGRCYQFGTGVQDDLKTAIEWYEKALDVIDDPELEQKVMMFKMLEEGGAFAN